LFLLSFCFLALQTFLAIPNIKEEEARNFVIGGRNYKNNQIILC
jgi:hypothetical protein